MVAACLSCGKEFSTYPSTKRQYCSSACWYARARANNLWGNVDRAEKACETCGKPFSIRPSEQLARFCSQRCMIAWRSVAIAPAKRRVVLMECMFCGNTYERRPSETAVGRSKFCSRHCHGSYTARSIGKVSRSEAQFFDVVEATGIRVERQKRIGRWTVDAYLPDFNLAIEFQGSYWHSLPGVDEKDTRKAISVVRTGCRLLRVSDTAFIEEGAAFAERVIEQDIRRCA